MPDPMLEAEWLVPFPVDVRLTLGVQGRGRDDPTFRVDAAGAIWRTSLTPDGPGTIRVLPARATAGVSAEEACENIHKSTITETRVRAQSWGPGASWLLGTLPGALGFYDDISGFDPTVAHAVIRDTAARYPGLRLGRTGRLLEALVPAVLEQKVVLAEARRAWKILLATFGAPPPGPAPAGMRVFPEPRAWRRVPSWEWHRAGVEAVRAKTIMHAAAVADSLERLLDVGHDEADRKLRTLPGIGPWTSAEVRQRAAGDPDAVSVGDYHLPNTVGWALAGRRRSDDAEMLRLLEPYAGHRYRATRFILASGVGGAPRRGPRMAVRDYRSC